MAVSKPVKKVKSSIELRWGLKSGDSFQSRLLGLEFPIKYEECDRSVRFSVVIDGIEVADIISFSGEYGLLTANGSKMFHSLGNIVPNCPNIKDAVTTYQGKVSDAKWIGIATEKLEAIGLTLDFIPRQFELRGCVVNKLGARVYVSRLVTEPDRAYRIDGDFLNLCTWCDYKPTKEHLLESISTTVARLHAEPRKDSSSTSGWYADPDTSRN